MQWSYEGKKLDAGVKHISWHPPWVIPAGDVADEFAGLLPENHRVRDAVGLGRIPSAWWTVNCKYNAVYDVHRLNVSDLLNREAVESYHDVRPQARYDFVRRAPDLVATAHVVRAELIMRFENQRQSVRTSDSESSNAEEGRTASPRCATLVAPLHWARPDS